MVRPSQRLHAPREVAVPRPAATMLLLRDSPDGPEVLMTRRAERASFAAGAYVFPGGAIDAADHQAHAIAAHRPSQTGYVLTQAIAAIRESFEELGILLALRPDGSMADAADSARLDRVPPVGESFASQCAAHSLRLAAGELRHFARWIADPNNPKRFDTAFFVGRMPEGQVPVADDCEQFEPTWVLPEQALERHRSGAFFMLFPTVRTLERLSVYASVASILDACTGEGPLTYNATRSGIVGGEIRRLSPDDPGYGEVALICPDGQDVPVLDCQHVATVSLLKNVARLAAPGGGVLSAGFNSYLVGDASTGCIVIDPGPDDPGHLRRLWDAAAGDIRMIVCTHPRHASGAIALHAMCGSAPALLGLPGCELEPRRRLVLAGAHATHSLRVIDTPARAGAGPCLLLEEDGLLFTGWDEADDGADASWLDAACRAHGAEFVLAGRGYVRVGTLALGSRESVLQP